MAEAAMCTPSLKQCRKKHKKKSFITRLAGHDFKDSNQEHKRGKRVLIQPLHLKILDPYHEDIIKWVEERLAG